MAELKLPTWITDLRPLVPVVGTLTTIATNPKAWIKQNLAEFVIGQIVGLFAWFYEWILVGFNIIGGSILNAADSAIRSLEPAGRALRELPMIVYEPVYAIARSGGLAAPIAAAIATLIAGSIALLFITTLAYALLSVVPGGDGVRDGVKAWLK